MKLITWPYYSAEFLKSQGLDEGFPKRFWDKVNFRGPIPEHCPEFGPCWLWTGYLDKDGYGQTGTRRRRFQAHAAAWILFHGPLQKGLNVLHHCDNPSCVNALSHVWADTPYANVLDAMLKGRMPKGEANGNSSLNMDAVREIKRLRKAGWMLKDIAPLFNVSLCQVSAISRGKSWKHTT